MFLRRLSPFSFPLAFLLSQVSVSLHLQRASQRLRAAVVTPCVCHDTAAQRARGSRSRVGAPEDYTKTETSEICWLETSRKEEGVGKCTSSIYKKQKRQSSERSRHTCTGRFDNLSSFPAIFPPRLRFPPRHGYISGN